MPGGRGTGPGRFGHQPAVDLEIDRGGPGRAPGLSAVPADRGSSSGRPRSRPPSLIERGEANPTLGTVRGIAAALGVLMGDLAKRADRFDDRE